MYFSKKFHTAERFLYLDLVTEDIGKAIRFNQPIDSL